MVSPLVSVCMPASRPSAMFDEAINSALDQTLQDFEIVVTDDSGGSLRRTVERLGDPRIRYSANPARLGLSGNHCRAIDLAVGRYVAILHDDDAWLPGHLSEVVDVFEAHDDVGLCIVGTVDVTHDGLVLRRKPTAMVDGVQPDPLSHLLDSRHPIMYPSSAVWRRSALASNHRPWPELVNADITAFVDPILSGWQLYYIEQPLVRYRVHTGQIGATDQFVHRDGQVRLWAAYRFAAPRHEAQRRQVLARWLIARAGAHLKVGRTREAQADLATAATVEGSVQRRRRIALTLLCRAPWMAIPGTWALETSRRLLATVA